MLYIADNVAVMIAAIKNVRLDAILDDIVADIYCCDFADMRLY